MQHYASQSFKYGSLQLIIRYVIRVIFVIIIGVVAYVEVRAEYENRSRAVEKQLKHLGADIANKITPEVTHVVFKGGRKATVKKAQKLGLLLVSVLWVER